jgi:hypothetical protein
MAASAGVGFPAGVVRAAAGDIPARLPYRDDDDAGCGLPGRVELPAWLKPAQGGAPLAP